MSLTTTSVRLDDEITARLDRVAEKLTERAAGLAVNRSGAIRVALQRGVDSLEAELGISGKRRKK